MIWEPETPDQRSTRRSHLFALDGLLIYVEQHNFEYGGTARVPGRLCRWYRYLGGKANIERGMLGFQLMEAVFELQEQYLLKPIAVLRRRRGMDIPDAVTDPRSLPSPTDRRAGASSEPTSPVRSAVVGLESTRRVHSYSQCKPPSQTPKGSRPERRRLLNWPLPPTIDLREQASQ